MTLSKKNWEVEFLLPYWVSSFLQVGTLSFKGNVYKVSEWKLPPPIIPIIRINYTNLSQFKYQAMNMSVQKYI